MKKEIEKIECSARDMAEVIGISPRRLQQLVKEGYLTRTARGRYPLVLNVEAYREFKISDPANTEYQEARLRKSAALAEKAELEIALARGELVEVAEVSKRWISIASQLRTNLHGLPTKLAPLCRDKTRVEIQKIVTDGINEVLSVLSDTQAVK